MIRNTLKRSYNTNSNTRNTLGIPWKKKKFKHTKKQPRSPILNDNFETEDIWHSLSTSFASKPLSDKPTTPTTTPEERLDGHGTSKVFKHTVIVNTFVKNINNFVKILNIFNFHVILTFFLIRNVCVQTYNTNNTTTNKFRRPREVQSEQTWNDCGMSWIFEGILMMACFQFFRFFGWFLDFEMCWMMCSRWFRFLRMFFVDWQKKTKWKKKKKKRFCLTLLICFDVSYRLWTEENEQKK